MKIKYPLVLICLSLLNILSAQHWTVTELSSMPEAVSNNAVCEGFVNGQPYVYSFGGIDETKEYSGIHNRAYRYNIQTDEWESIAPLPDPMGKIASGASRVDDIIYIIGGYYVFENGSETSSNRVHRYNTQSNTYLEDGASIPVSIDDHVQAVYKDSLIYVITGWHDTQNVTDVQIYDPVANEWHQGTPISWMEEASFGASGTIIGDTIYFYGGAKNGDFGASRRLRKGAINPDNPLEISWSSEVLSFSLTAYRPAATSVGNNVYFLGGSDQTYNFDGLAYSNGAGVNPNNRSLVYQTSTGSFEEDLSNNLPMDLRGIANENDTVKYISGGMLSNQVVTNKLWKLVADITTSTLNPNLNIDFIKTFPNPAKQYLYIEIPTDLDCNNLQIQIFNQVGTNILEIQNRGCENQIDIESLVPGIYQINISDGIHSGISRFVKI